jgi:hypothetical protein
MSLVTVGARVPARSLKYAAIGLNLPPTTSKQGLMRAALALFHGRTLEEAHELALPISRKQPRLAGESELIDIAGEVEADLAKIPEDIERATAIRIGLAIAQGWTAEEAKTWAMDIGRRGPRPKRDAAITTGSADPIVTT